MARKKIFIDFDDVLFDTVKFKLALFDIFKKIGIPEDVIQKKYSEAGYPDGCFKPLKMVDLVAEVTWSNPEMAAREAEKINAKIVNLEIRSYKYIMEGAKEFLSSFDRQQNELTILTYGDPDFQKVKITASGLGPPLVDEVIPTASRKDHEIARKIEEGEVFVLIDDKTGTLDLVRASFPNAELYESFEKFQNDERYIKEPDEETKLPIS